MQISIKQTLKFFYYDIIANRRFFRKKLITVLLISKDLEKIAMAYLLFLFLNIL